MGSDNKTNDPFEWSYWYEQFLTKCRGPRNIEIPERDIRMMQHAFMAGWASMFAVFNGLMASGATPTEKNMYLAQLSAGMNQYRIDVDNEHAAEDEISRLMNDINKIPPEEE